jgi:hypothetical protein
MFLMSVGYFLFIFLIKDMRSYNNNIVEARTRNSVITTYECDLRLGRAMDSLYSSLSMRHGPDDKLIQFSMIALTGK